MSDSIISYQDATGVIEYTLKSDLMFHYVMQKSERALRGLICSLKGISESMIKDIEVLNPIDLNNLSKETVMDIKLVLNNNEIMNIELQVYTDKYWIQRSILYLCRAYDSIGSGDDYSKIKPSTLFSITDQDLFPENPEFYAEYLLLNTKNHHPYTKNFGIKVLELNHTDIATQKDIDNNLVYWAEIFKADTWEKFRALADGRPDIEEVGYLMLEINADNLAKEKLERQRRYREMMASQYTAGYTDAEEKYDVIIAEKDAALADKDAALADKDAALAVKDAALADRDATIADQNALLRKYIEKYGNLD